MACRNLASHVLGRAARVVGDDCERCYGYRPWLLETFVDEGACMTRPNGPVVVEIVDA